MTPDLDIEWITTLRQSQATPSAPANDARIAAPTVATLPMVSMENSSLDSGSERRTSGRFHRRRPEQPDQLLGVAVVDLDDVADLDALEQVFDVAVSHPDAAVRGGAPDRAGDVRSVDAEALAAQAEPAGAERIGLSGQDRTTRRVVGRARNAVDDRVASGWARRLAGSDRGGVDLQEPAVLDERELSVRNADHDPARRPLLGDCPDCCDQHQGNQHRLSHGCLRFAMRESARRQPRARARRFNELREEGWREYVSQPTRRVSADTQAGGFSANSKVTTPSIELRRSAGHEGRAGRLRVSKPPGRDRSRPSRGRTSGFPSAVARRVSGRSGRGRRCDTRSGCRAWSGLRSRRADRWRCGTWLDRNANRAWRGRSFRASKPRG